MMLTDKERKVLDHLYRNGRSYGMSIQTGTGMESGECFNAMLFLKKAGLIDNSEPHNSFMYYITDTGYRFIIEKLLEK